MSTPTPVPAGWLAIDQALAGLYGPSVPYQVRPTVPHQHGGADWLDAISVFTRSDPIPHWHYVSYGLSELYTKNWPDPDLSGWGLELTLRLAHQGGAEPASSDGRIRPPQWPIHLLQGLASYINTTGNVVAAGHHLDLGHPMDQMTMRPEGPGELSALLMVNDIELGTIDTPHGHVTFVQVIGITPNEMAAKIMWNAAGVVRILAQDNELLVIDPGRTSAVTSPSAQALIAAGKERDGSTSGWAHLPSLIFQAPQTSSAQQPAHLILDSSAANYLPDLISSRLERGRLLQLVGPAAVITLLPGKRSEVGLTYRDDQWYITVEQADVARLARFVKRPSAPALLIAGGLVSVSVQE